MVEFSPDSWDRSASTIREDAGAFASRAESVMSGMTTSSLGCDGNGTAMDMAFSIVFPVSIQAFRDAAAGLARGLGNASDAMGAVASSYRTTEADNEAVASQAGQ